MASGDSVLTKSFLCQWFNLEVLKEFLVECVLVRTKIEKNSVKVYNVTYHQLQES